MIGTKTRATQNMISRVSSLDVASQSVRALARSVDEGITNGNSVKPVIRMIDAIANELNVKAKPLLPSLAMRLVRIGRATEAATSAHNIGKAA